MNPSHFLRTLAAVSLLAGLEAATPAAADSPAAAATAASDSGPDGMGHLPGHQHAQAGGMADGEPGAAGGHHHGDGGSAAAGHDSEGDGDACAMDDDDGDGGHSGHGMMGMHGMAHMHGMEHMHGMMTGHGGRPGHDGHGGDADGADATLEAVSAPAAPAWLAGLELTDDQQDRIFAILHEVAPAQRKAARTAESTHRQLRHAGMATDYSEAAARKLSDQHAQAINELTLLRIRTEKRILDVLTPEQKHQAAHQAARQD